MNLTTSKECARCDSIETISGSHYCRSCLKAKQHATYLKHRDKIIVRVRKYEQENKEKVRACHNAYAKLHRLEFRERHNRWVKANPERNKVQKNAWAHKNTKHLLALNRKRWAAKINRTPPFGQDGITNFYKNCPFGMQVDHVIPLQGKLVSGLHVVWNLQYLTPAQNMSKGNKYGQR